MADFSPVGQSYSAVGTQGAGPTNDISQTVAALSQLLSGASGSGSSAGGDTAAAPQAGGGGQAQPQDLGKMMADFMKQQTDQILKQSQQQSQENSKAGAQGAGGAV